MDDLAFRYGPAEPAAKPTTRGFGIVMERQEGKGAFRVVLDHPGAQNPIRLLMEYHWPPSPQEVEERFDIAEKAVFASLKGEWQCVMAEARIRAQCAVYGNSAMRYLSDTLLRLPFDQAEVFDAPVSFATIGLNVSPQEQTDDPLRFPAYELKIEPLREDPAALYLEIMSRWSQVPVGAGAIELSRIRPIDRDPHEYVDATYQALQGWVSKAASAAGGRK